MSNNKLRIVLFTMLIGLPVFLFAQTEDPAARLRVFAPGQTSAPLEQAWFQFNTAGHTAPIRAICFSEDAKKLYTAGEDKVVRFWNLDEMQETQCIRWRVGRENWGRISAIAQCGHLVAFAGQAANSWTQEIWIVNAKTGEYQTILRPTGAGDCVVDILFLGSENRLASLQANGTVEVWEKTTSEWKKTVIPHQSDEQTLNLLLPRDKNLRLQMLQHLAQDRFQNTLVFFDNRYIIYPIIEDISKSQRKWHLAFYDLQLRKEHVHPFEFEPVVSAAADSKRKILFVADQSNRIYELPFSVQKSKEVSPIVLGTADNLHSIINMSVSGDGTRLVAGTSKRSIDSKSRDLFAHLCCWTRNSSSKWQALTPIKFTESIDACRISSDGQKIALSQYADTTVMNWDEIDSKNRNSQTPLLLSTIHPIGRIAFSADSNYQIAWNKQSQYSEQQNELNEKFDPQQIRYETINKNSREKWQPVYGLSDKKGTDLWELRLVTISGGIRYQVFCNNKYFSDLAIDPVVYPIFDRQVDENDKPTALWWFADAKGQVKYLLAGTCGLSKDIFVFRLERGKSSLVRRFRGHSAAVTSLSVSSDRRYMVSASLDSTIRFWSLKDLEIESPIEQRFGMKLRLGGNGKNLVVENITEDSPLFIRGVRKNCRLIQIMVSDALLKNRSITNPREMLTEIAEVDWQKQIGFEFESTETSELSDGKIPSFAVSPTRREIAALATFQTTTDFAYWTPFGYYTASADGSHCFGWLYNRGLRGIPEFVTADSFKNNLENRPLMMRLLDTGSLEGAWNKLKANTVTYIPDRRLEGNPVSRPDPKPESGQSSTQTTHTPPKPPQPLPTKPEPTQPTPTPPQLTATETPIAVAPPRQLTYNALLAEKPSIEILLPKTREELAANTIHIEAKACFPKQKKSSVPKLFTNGIRAGFPDKTIDESDSSLPNVRFVRYVWNNIRLPADPFVQVKILLESDSQTFMASDYKIAVRHNVTSPPRPKMYLVLLGTDYSDIKSEFPELPGVKNTVEKVRNTVTNASGLMYDVEVFSYLNESATLKNWRSFVNDFKKNRMSEVRPDDMFVIYLAGHGSLDPDSGKYYFAMFDTKYNDYCHFKYNDSLSFDDILPFAEIPCRRVLLMETCQFSPHELKDPLTDYRRLEDEQFLLLLAAEPGRSAIWTDNNTIGRFTKYLIEGWQGGADGFDPTRRQIVDQEKDGKVTFAENYSYLVDKFRQINRSTMERQMVEVFGKDLLRYIDIPLSEHQDCPTETRGVRVVVTPRKPLGDITEISPQ
jgi:WD40 repeat protein